MVEICTLHLTMQRTLLLKLRPAILTKVEIEHVDTKLLKGRLKLLITQEYQQRVQANSRPLLPKDQSQLELKPIELLSKDIMVVSLTALNVEPILTTEFQLLVMVQRTVKSTILSKTHGVLIGVNQVLLESPSPKELVSVESNSTLSGQKPTENITSPISFIQ